MGAFGGGLGGNGEVCGAAAGALAVMGLRFSRASAAEKEDPRMWSACREVLQRFRNEIAKGHGGILCREIARVDWHDRDAVRSFYKSDRVRECARIVGDTALLTGELLERAAEQDTRREPPKPLLPTLEGTAP